jgi:DNA invertase Pin-like site-specific DNA recombinase
MATTLKAPGGSPSTASAWATRRGARSATTRYELRRQRPFNGKQHPEWDRLLADVEVGKIDAIAAWNQDRSCRMTHELEELPKFITGLGRRIPLATTGQGDVDLYSPTGVLTAQIKTAATCGPVSAAGQSVSCRWRSTGW